MKVLTILCDGMRPDSFMHLPEAQALLAKSSYDLKAQTVFPSVTLPCHLSLFHSVTPERHNNMTNTYTPMVRPVMSMLEQLHWAHKTNAMFYSWEELRDMCRQDPFRIHLYNMYVSGEHRLRRMKLLLR